MAIIRPENMDFSNQRFSAIIYGSPGVGKTTLALSAPSPVLIDFDRGISRVKAVHRCPTIICSTYEEVMEDIKSPSMSEFQTIVSFELNEKLPSLTMADKFRNGDKLTIRVGKHRKKRGLDANAYYWKLLGQLANALEISNPHCHNLMLRRYGVLQEFGGKNAYTVILDTDEATREADESETYHIKPTSQVKEGKDGKMYRTYMLLKGSSSFDTAEMSRLISGLRDECRQVGIPYETPDEIAQLVSLMESRQYG